MHLQTIPHLDCLFYCKTYLMAHPNIELIDALRETARRLGNQEGVRQLADQLRQRYPNSPEWAKYLRGAFDE